MTETITSPQNPKLKLLRKLGDRKHRDRQELFVAEGEDLLAEALRFGRPPEVVFYDAEIEGRLEVLDRLPASVDANAVLPEVLAASSSLGSGTRTIGVWGQAWYEPYAPELSDEAPLLYLHRPSDPGNVGTAIRAAHALGAAGVVLSPESVDPHGPKAVRASMGAVFAVPLVRAEFDQLAGTQPNRTKIAMVAGAGRTLREAASSPAPLFVLGSERDGVPDRISSVCDEIAHIPLESGGAESLNVAMAATLCLYENALHRLAATAKEPKT